MGSSTDGQQASSVSKLADECLSRASEWLAKACWAELGAKASFADFEARLYAIANEAARRQIEARLQQIEDGHTEQVLVAGKRYRRHECGKSMPYHSLVGTVHVRRSTYREIGVRNGPTVVPLDLAAGLIHWSTPALAYSAAHGYSAGPMRHYEVQMKAAHRAVPPRATLERLALSVGGCAAQDVRTIEPSLRASETLPPNAHALAVSLDRTAVAMAEERPPGTPPNSRRKPRSAPYQREPPEPIDVNWRMIYVGTVSVVDSDGEVITTRKYHATPEEETDEIMARMMADVAHCRATKLLPVAVVQDGAPEMWNVVRAALRANGVRKWTEVIDRYHVNERLAAALELIERDGKERRQRLEKWGEQLDRSPRAIYRIAKWIETKWRAMPRESHKAQQLDGHVGYISGYASKMNYAAYRRAGLPIGSGAVEGACKSLVGFRAKRSGQRWKQDGLTAALTLRSLEQSGRLASFWQFFAKRFSADIRAL